MPPQPRRMSNAATGGAVRIGSVMLCMSANHANANVEAKMPVETAATTRTASSTEA